METLVRWVNFKERSPVERDSDSQHSVVVRYTVEGRAFHTVEHWRRAGLLYWLPDAAEWLDYSDSQITSEPQVATHIRKVEL